MNKKRLGIALISICFILLIGFVGFSVNASHEKAEEEKKQEEIKKKVALDAKKALEENTQKSVSELFANETKTLLSDKFSLVDVTTIEENIKKITTEKLKTNLTDDIEKAKELYKLVESSKEQVQKLFKDNHEDVLAEGITRTKVDETNKNIKEKTPQNKAKTELESKIKKAYNLIKDIEKNNEKDSKQMENTPTNGGNSDSQSGSNVIEKKDDKDTKNNTKSNSNKSSNSAKQYADGSTERPSNKTKGTNDNSSQPIVSQMKLASRTNQIITVVASGSSAQVKFWEKSNGVWKQLLSTSGMVGSQGVGSADEYHSRTPRGAYSLGFAFGTSNPGTSLPFRKITNKSYWISNVNDSQYNTWQERSSSNKADEHMASYPTQYRYGVVINYNTSRVKGAGSGFFLHCSNGAPTAGCVAIPTSQMATVLKNLHSGAYIVNVTSEKELLNY
ncbi:L,D-transpeptidase family protein [Listeria innocua]